MLVHFFCFEADWKKGRRRGTKNAPLAALNMASSMIADGRADRNAQNLGIYVCLRVACLKRMHFCSVSTQVQSGTVLVVDIVLTCVPVSLF